ILWGGIYTLSYVLGMVAPLFLIAFYLDKINFTQKFVSLRKPRTLKIKDFTWHFNLASAVAGFVFLGVGIYIIYLALVNRLAMQSSYQLSTNIFVANIVSSIRGFTQKVPESVWAGIVLLIFFMLIIYAIKQFKKHD
ncbi:MAG: hypothetical protein AAB948_02720, partial [Patescibacteria group bacterium]